MPLSRRLEKAVAAVEGYLLRYAPEGMTPKIYIYNDAKMLRKWAGVMVAEVSFSSALGVASFMRVDVPWGIAVCGQTERAILAFIEEWPDEDKQEELDRLAAFCFPNRPLTAFTVQIEPLEDL
jgi:hypothetical protein